MIDDWAPGFERRRHLVSVSIRFRRMQMVATKEPELVSVRRKSLD